MRSQGGVRSRPFAPRRPTPTGSACRAVAECDHMEASVGGGAVAVLGLHHNEAVDALLALLAFVAVQSVDGVFGVTSMTVLSPWTSKPSKLMS